MLYPRKVTTTPCGLVPARGARGAARSQAKKGPVILFIFLFQSTNQVKHSIFEISFHCTDFKMSDCDRDSLMCIYESTTGHRWHKQLNWTSNLRLGRWHGVTVEISGHVESLILNDNRLEGRFPDSERLKALRNLKCLAISSNLLKQEVSTSIDDWTHSC